MPGYGMNYLFMQQKVQHWHHSQGNWEDGAMVCTSPSLSLHVTPTLHFHSAIALSAKEESSPHPRDIQRKIMPMLSQG